MWRDVLVGLVVPAPNAVAAETLPPLKWAGGKRWLAPRLNGLYEAAGSPRLVEPFCGGLSVTLGVQPSVGLCNDINESLINFYRWWQFGLASDATDGVTERVYLEMRDEFNALLRTPKRASERAARLFYALNKTGFNGLCRFNKRGGFNVPYGKRSTVAALSEAPDFLQRILFLNVSFEHVPLEPGDFVYADPPYDVEFTTYSAGGFTWADQVRAAKWLAQHPGPVALSNQATPRIVDLYASLGFDIAYVDAPRRISCNGDRRPAREVLATRNIESAKGDGDAARPGDSRDSDHHVAKHDRSSLSSSFGR